MCKVSICIPVHNNVEQFRRLLKSIENQTYSDYEIIVSDNSGGIELSQEFDKYSFNQSIYLNSDNTPPAVNWNNALKNANGEYIKIMFQDDWFTFPESLHEYVEMLESNPKIDMAFSGSRQCSDSYMYDRHIELKRLLQLKINYKTIAIDNYIGAPSATIVRNKDFLFDENMKWFVDMELYYRVLSKNSRFTHSNRPLVSIGVSSSQLTNECVDNKKLQINEYEYMLKKHKLDNNHACLMQLEKIKT